MKNEPIKKSNGTVKKVNKSRVKKIDWLNY
jgi:hypothetical protein